jgi:hypothetical protein
MPASFSASAHIHNAACETAALADCHCFCHGAGHQSDLIARAASCSNSADHATLQSNLEKVLGGFHTSFQDSLTHTRSARNVPSSAQLAALNDQIRSGATWYETLLVDEALHTMFLEISSRSLASTPASRRDRQAFVERITGGAIAVVGSKVILSNVVESHVWCSIVAEYVCAAGLKPAEPPPVSFSDICYPRKTRGSTPTSLAHVRAAGLKHLASAEAQVHSLSKSERLELLRLVGAATCPDLWHHAAAVRFCVRPFVLTAGWPAPGTTTLASRLQFDALRRRWQRKGHW